MDTNQIIIGISGICIGGFIGNHKLYEEVMSIIIVYMLIIISIRIFLSYLMLFISKIKNDINNEIKKNDANKSFLYEIIEKLNIDDILNENIWIYYNIWYNRITVKRNMFTKLSTDSEKIEFILRRLFDSFLLIDLSYHYMPLTIKFE